MNFKRWWRAAAVGCLILVSIGCDDSSGYTGGGGVGGADPGPPCDEAAIQKCLDLQDCCRAILVNPVFFQSCNNVVLQCDEAQCQEVLDGYPQCAPDPEPDAGVGGGGGSG